MNRSPEVGLDHLTMALDRTEPENMKAKDAAIS
jgi:hypothetical protein